MRPSMHAELPSRPSSSKKSMKGAKVDLVQVTSGITKALEKLGKGAPKFEYQSNDIIATIEDLQATFKSMKKDLDMEEHDINSAFERDRLGLQNQKAFAESPGMKSRQSRSPRL